MIRVVKSVDEIRNERHQESVQELKRMVKSDPEAFKKALDIWMAKQKG